VLKGKQITITKYLICLIFSIFTLKASTLYTRATEQTGSQQNTSSTDTVIPYQVPFKSEIIALKTSENGICYQLSVRQPLRKPKEGEKVVTVYLFDALWNFPAVATMLSNAEFLGHLPPLLIVGVGYADNIDGGRDENRVRDYTPTSFAPKDGKHFLRPAEYIGSGGAGKFLDVMEKQIIPTIEKRYATVGSQRVVAGKSLGGLAASFALLTRPNLFSHYLIISPALWWDDYFLNFDQRAIGQLEQQTKKNKLQSPVSVYIAMGDGEERLGMLADVTVFARSMRLCNDANLTLKIQQLSGEIHETMFAAGYVYGIRYLLGQTHSK
jgi:predicted alpha/beta superfamily hydrolase